MICSIKRRVPPGPSSFICPRYLLILLTGSAVYFFPLFLMPWVPVLRGPLLAFAFAASSDLAFASVGCSLGTCRVLRPEFTHRLSASRGTLCLPRPSLSSLSWELLKASPFRLWWG